MLITKNKLNSLDNLLDKIDSRVFEVLQSLIEKLSLSTYDFYEFCSEIDLINVVIYKDHQPQKIVKITGLKIDKSNGDFINNLPAKIITNKGSFFISQLSSVDIYSLVFFINKHLK